MWELDHLRQRQTTHKSTMGCLQSKVPKAHHDERRHGKGRKRRGRQRPRARKEERRDHEDKHGHPQRHEKPDKEATMVKEDIPALNTTGEGNSLAEKATRENEVFPEPGSQAVLVPKPVNLQEEEQAEPVTEPEPKEEEKEEEASKSSSSTSSSSSKASSPKQPSKDTARASIVPVIHGQYHYEGYVCAECHHPAWCHHTPKCSLQHSFVSISK